MSQSQKLLRNYPQLISEKAARRLWFSVLELAIEDLTHKTKPRYRARAKAWLLSSDSDLCIEALGANPEQFRETLFAHLNTHLPVAA